MPIGSLIRPARGFTFVAVLAMLVIIMLGLSVAGPHWADATKRERERELKRIGAMYARALEHYRDVSPGSVKELPLQLESLARDTRFVGVMRHLRQLYPDPIDPNRPWGLVVDREGRIQGVYSLASGTPMSAQLPARPASTPPASYSEWKFLARSNP